MKVRTVRQIKQQQRHQRQQGISIDRLKTIFFIIQFLAEYNLNRNQKNYRLKYFYLLNTLK